jgi:uncharacterized short protein YbdD (DUF466 family)
MKPEKQNKPDEIVLTEEEFRKFNRGSADRFGFFTEAEKDRLETEAGLFERKTAYNYHRISPEIEETEWEFFFRDLVKELFVKYDYITVTSDNEIFGINQGERRLLKKHPDAYAAAQKIKAR